MSISKDDSGIAAAHITAIEKVTSELNIFLFARPTELDSTLLIENGYATKSMDIHDKSSNWGPMAGFVPCDPAFCKRPPGKPQPAIHPHGHGQAKVVQLSLTDQLVAEQPKFRPLVTVPAELKLFVPDPTQAKIVQANPIEPGNKSTKFLLEKTTGGWKVWWLNEMPGNPRKVDKVPLWVWAYGETPVTGDYDLWMVAPHISWWRAHSQIVAVDDDHGSSCASLFITSVLDKLNVACGRASKPVFNHGAEAQNYSFTQAIDRHLAMFTPKGSRRVERSDMPEIMYDLQKAGYIVLWNKRYGERDPYLMGSPVNASIETCYERLREIETKGASGARLPGGGNLGEAKARALIAKNLGGGGTRMTDAKDILDFGAQLKKLNESLSRDGRSIGLKKLTPMDLPKDYLKRAGGTDSMQLQLKLQAALVKLSEMPSGVVQNRGGTGTAMQFQGPSPEKFQAWYEQEGRSLMAELGGMFGDRDVPTRLKRIPGTNSYEKAPRPA